MANCLIALGSNLGERAEILRQAVSELSRLASSQLLARSRWHETPPVGGPSGQGPFLNGAALVATELAPVELHRELAAIESRLGRVRHERWAARAIDLDLLLYGDVELRTAELTVPHPRMAYRRFVLAPAAEIAPWMLHPESGWTVGRLRDHLDDGGDSVVVADADRGRASHLVARLSSVVAIDVHVAEQELSPRPKLIIATAGDPGVPANEWRKMLDLPASGPIAWMTGDADEAWLAAAAAAVQSVWPSRC